MKLVRCMSVVPLATILVSGLAGCVANTPLAQQSPDVGYSVKRNVVVAVFDQRPELAEGKPVTYIGRAHSVFGIPADIQVYPWIAADKAKKDQSLANAIA